MLEGGVGLVGDDLRRAGERAQGGGGLVIREALGAQGREVKQQAGHEDGGQDQQLGAAGQAQASMHTTPHFTRGGVFSPSPRDGRCDSRYG